MSTITDQFLLNQISKLSPTRKLEVADFIDKCIETESIAPAPPPELHNSARDSEWLKSEIERIISSDIIYRDSGWAKGLIEMSDDFDEDRKSVV
jgi:hypothetical protein